MRQVPDAMGKFLLCSDQINTYNYIYYTDTVEPTAYLTVLTNTKNCLQGTNRGTVTHTEGVTVSTVHSFDITSHAHVHLHWSAARPERRKQSSDQQKR